MIDAVSGVYALILLAQASGAFLWAAGMASPKTVGVRGASRWLLIAGIGAVLFWALVDLARTLGGLSVPPAAMIGREAGVAALLWGIILTRGRFFRSFVFAEGHLHHIVRNARWRKANDGQD